jgi:hypothetical protein
MPVTENPVPAAVMFEIVNVAFPAFVSDTCAPTFCPTATPPNATPVGFTESAGCPWATMPVAVIGTTRLEVEELFVNVMLPLMFPADCGTILATTVVAWPAESVIGKVTPVTENPEPAAETFEIVSVPVPVLVIDICAPTFAPTATPPKLTRVGVTEIAGCPPVLPVPESAIVETAGFVLAVIETLPVTAPAAVGANLTEKDVL